MPSSLPMTSVPVANGPGRLHVISTGSAADLHVGLVGWVTVAWPAASDVGDQGPARPPAGRACHQRLLVRGVPGLRTRLQPRARLGLSTCGSAAGKLTEHHVDGQARALRATVTVTAWAGRASGQCLRQRCGVRRGRLPGRPDHVTGLVGAGDLTGLDELPAMSRARLDGMAKPVPWAWAPRCGLAAASAGIADHLPGGVYQRAAAVAGVDRRAGLDRSRQCRGLMSPAHMRR